MINKKIVDINDIPSKVTLINKNTRRCRIVHLITRTKEKSFKFASVNCKQWAKKYGFPFILKVTYCTDKKNQKGQINEMTSKNYPDLNWSLKAFIKEYMN